jgi:hypothetical protein
MSVVLKPRYTPEQYLDIERAADYKSEYFDGEIFAMAGASEEHNTITFNLSGAHWSRNCAARLPWLRGRHARDGSRLPTCTPTRTWWSSAASGAFGDEHLDTLLNPTLPVEVLSPSTEGLRPGAEVRELSPDNVARRPTVLVAQDRAHIEKFERWPDGHGCFPRRAIWPAICRFPSIGCTLDPGRSLRQRFVPAARPAAGRSGGRRSEPVFRPQIRRNAPRATCASGPGANGCGRPVRE